MIFYQLFVSKSQNYKIINNHEKAPKPLENKAFRSCVLQHHYKTKHFGAFRVSDVLRFKSRTQRNHYKRKLKSTFLKTRKPSQIIKKLQTIIKHCILELFKFDILYLFSFEINKESRTIPKRNKTLEAQVCEVMIGATRQGVNIYVYIYI